MDLRRFDDARLRLCDEWFAAVETRGTWDDLGPVGEGESESRKLECRATGQRAAAKPGPGKAEDPICRAAHEKIAFDLAHLLKLPVAPVILWPEALGAPYVRGRSICAWCFAQCETWDVAIGLGLLTQELIDSTSPVSSAMRVFHSWISDTDRGGKHVFVDTDRIAAPLPVAYIDHSWGFSHEWQVEPHPNPSITNYMHADEDRGTVEMMVDRVAGLPPDEIDRIVGRIPSGYLPSAERGRILSNLHLRQGNLRSLLGLS